MMRTLLLFIAIAALCIAQPKGSLSGRVLDPSGATVPNARITLTDRLTNTRLAAKTDSEGAYSVGIVRSGDYLVEAQAPGFGLSEVQMIRIDGTQRLDLKLDLPLLTSQVQVTASSIGQTVDEESKVLTVIDAAQLEARNEFSVAEALRTTPGVRIQQLGGPGSMVRILTRGTRATDTSVLIDGFRFRDAAAPQGDVTSFASDLLTTGVERIEVCRGSGSSLWGTHATGGVVNLITDTGTTGFHGDIGGEGGSLGLARGTARFSGTSWSDRFRYSGALTHLNVMTGVDGDDRTRNSVAHGFTSLQLGESSTLSGRLLASNAFLQLNDSPYALPNLPPGPRVQAIPYVTFMPNLNDPDNRRSSDYMSGLVSLVQTLSPSATLRLSYHGLTTSRDVRDGPAGQRFEPPFANSSVFDGGIHTFQARSDFQLGRWNTLTAGYEFERESFNNLSVDENPVVADRTNARLQIAQNSNSAYVQDQIRLMDNRLQISLSGRVQDYDLNSPQFTGGDSVYGNVELKTPPRAWTGDASIAYHWASTGTKFRAHTGNSYRSPGLYERYGASYFTGSFSAYGDPNLAPERLLSLDGGFDQYIGQRIRFSGTYFYTRIQQSIFFDFSGAINPVTDPYGRFGGYLNTGGGLARGMEWSVEASPIRSLRILGSYTYTNSDERDTSRAIRVSSQMFTGTVTQQIGRRLDVTFDIFAASNYLYPLGGRAFEFQGPVKADISANYTIPINDRTRLRFFTRVENFSNRTNYEDGFFTPGTWAVGGFKVMF